MTTMHEKYGDGSDCTVCERCGYCVDHGDCWAYGCGKEIEKPGSTDSQSEAVGHTPTRKQAIKILNRASDRGVGFDDWWPELMEDFGLYNEETDNFPSIYDVFAALGVTEAECREAGV